MKWDLAFWINSEVVMHSWSGNVPLPREVFCVDLLDTEPDHRYGKFSKEVGWRHIPKDQFPKEFLVQLLLLGVPT